MAKRILGIRADWRALAFCVLTACTFWLLKAMNRNYTDVISYPFKIEYDKKRFVPLNQLPDRIQINVKGYGWSLFKKSMGFKADALVFRPKNPLKSKFVTANDLLPLITIQLSEINLNYIVDDTIFFSFDRLKVKKVKVYIDSSEISLAPSYKIHSPIIISPDTVKFEGPASLLRDIPDSIFVKIPEEDIREDFEDKIKIPDPGFDYRIKMVNNEVKIRFSVGSFEKLSTAVKAEMLNFPKDKNLSFDSKIIITYFVNPEDRGKVSRKDFKLRLDYKKMDKEDSTIVPVLYIKPSFIKEVHLTPYAVKIHRKK